MTQPTKWWISVFTVGDETLLSWHDILSACFCCAAGLSPPPPPALGWQPLRVRDGPHQRLCSRSHHGCWWVSRAIMTFEDAGMKTCILAVVCTWCLCQCLNLSCNLQLSQISQVNISWETSHKHFFIRWRNWCQKLSWFYCLQHLFLIMFYSAEWSIKFNKEAVITNQISHITVFLIEDLLYSL